MEKENKMPLSIDPDRKTPVPTNEIPLDLSKKTNSKSFKIDEILMKKKKFKCMICFKNFARKSSRKIHTETVHEGKKPFKCDRCKGFSTSNKRDLQRHIDVVHEGKRPFQCSVCKTEYGRKSHLFLHIKRVHNKP